MPEYPEQIVVDWCINARVKGKGKPLTHETMGSGAEATAAMALWLDAIEVEGDKVEIKMTAELTSEQVPGAAEVLEYKIKGLSAPSSGTYAKGWLTANGTLPGWGSGP